MSQTDRDLSPGSAVAEESPDPPKVPVGRDIELADLGTVVVRDTGEHPTGPTVVLLHGWTATADINFFTCYEPLARHARVIAFDHRGHGRGLRSKKPFRLQDCADDIVGVCDALGVDTFIPVGYSMGGPIAQLTWRRHRERVEGLVMCATAPYFAGRRPERLSFVGLTGLARLARYTPSQARDWISDQVYLQRKSDDWGPWAAEQVGRHDWRMILEAGRAIGEFSSTDWIREVDVPTAVIVTMDDPVVPRRRQVKLWDWIPGAEVYRVQGGHDAVVANAQRFVPTLIRAIDGVRVRERR